LLNFAEVASTLLEIEVSFYFQILPLKNPSSSSESQFQLIKTPQNPTKICKTCKNQILQFFLFKEKCFRQNQNLGPSRAPGKPPDQEIFDEDVFDEVVMVVKSYMSRFSVASVEIEEDSERLIISSTTVLSDLDLVEEPLCEEEIIEQEPNLILETVQVEEVEEETEILKTEEVQEQFEITIIKTDEVELEPEIPMQNVQILRSHQSKSKIKLEPPLQLDTKHQKIVVCEYCRKIFPKSSEFDWWVPQVITNQKPSFRSPGSRPFPRPQNQMQEEVLPGHIFQHLSALSVRL
jgi:hypothetical protein